MLNVVVLSVAFFILKLSVITLSVVSPNVVVHRAILQVYSKKIFTRVNIVLDERADL